MFHVMAGAITSSGYKLSAADKRDRIMTERYCKYKMRYVIVSTYNMDCWCALYCPADKRCTTATCKTRVNRELNDESKRNCRNCIRYTNKLRELQKVK